MNHLRQVTNRFLRQHPFLLGYLVFLLLVIVVETFCAHVVTQWYGVPWTGGYLVAYRFFLLLGFFFLGISRAVQGNPAYQDEYRQWLLTTPWSPEKPLPLGPVRLTVLDLVLLLVGTVVRPVDSAPWAVALAFLGTYSGVLIATNYRSGQDGATFFCITTASLLPLAIFYSITDSIDWPVFALLFVITAVCQWAWLRTLNSFPWENLPGWKFQFLGSKTKRPERRDNLWPRVHPWEEFDVQTQVTPRQILYLACLWGWVAAMTVFTIQETIKSAVGDYSEEEFALVASLAWGIPLVAAVTLALMRFIRYRPHCSPPLSLWARLRTGRWLLSKHDHVYTAPLAVLLGGLMGAGVLALLPFHLALEAFIGTAIPTALAFGLGPSLAEWRLTGGYRMSVAPPTENRTQWGKGIEQPSRPPMSVHSQ
ncbi:hypothetical protein [Adhaeretor mobilis]|uniref:Uncharacterized protein n=1 Tax=Adhaeretor mobilis TaxID=1930276 RepID=A0A517MTX3_9BACT|nr:hypothetical protein [Adhaeretor mobilis]QDS98338.1 hypothetical protein HG15A2_16110 [Adhaeretor mobilis]